MRRTERECPWDLLPWAYELGYDYGDLEPGERLPDLCRRKRCEAFESVAPIVGDRELMDLDGSRIPAELRREHGQRILYWRSKWFAARMPSNAFARIMLAVTFFWLVVVSGIALTFGLLLLWRFHKGWYLVAIVFGGLVGIPLFIWRMRSLIHRRRIRRALFDGECPSCGYALSDAMLGDEPRPVSWIPIGPARCPECGTYWPLVPPPVPSN